MPRGEVQPGHASSEAYQSSSRTTAAAASDDDAWISAPAERLRTKAAQPQQTLQPDWQVCNCISMPWHVCPDACIGLTARAYTTSPTAPAKSRFDPTPNLAVEMHTQLRLVLPDDFAWLYVAHGRLSLGAAAMNIRCAKLTMQAKRVHAGSRRGLVEERCRRSSRPVCGSLGGRLLLWCVLRIVIIHTVRLDAAGRHPIRRCLLHRGIQTEEWNVQ